MIFCKLVRPDTTRLNQETENMEVLHHPDLHHKTKKFKEYFSEFIMIFLAVTLGFIAENVREHFTERSKERQYIEGFIRNLKDDTATLHHVIEFDNRLVKGLDSMQKISHLNMAIDSNRKLFYHFATEYLYSSASFKSNDATLQQLKNTGDYRLIEKDHVADSLTKYDADIHGIYDQGDYYEAYFKEILSRLDDLMDVTVIDDTSFSKNGKMTDKPFPPLRGDKEKLSIFFNKVFDLKVITYSYAERNLKPQLEIAKNLIAFLKKEYGIED